MGNRLCLCSLVLLLVSSSVLAQTTTPRTWEQVRQQFEQNNPTLLAGKLNIDESRAQEIAAYLRPNPEFSITADQIGHNTTSNPFKEMLNAASVSYLHQRQQKRELRRDSAKEFTAVTESTYSDQERGLLFNLRTAFVQTLQAKAVQRVEGRLFKPMAWTVAFALLGAIIFSILIAPALASLFLPKGTREWQNPVMLWLTGLYRDALRLAIRMRFLPVGVGIGSLCLAIYLTVGGVICSEFLPHLDEAALWVRGTLAPTTGPTEGIRLSNQARILLCSWPQVTQCTSQTGRRDDGTDTSHLL